jgi:hypothetical protein
LLNRRLTLKGVKRTLDTLTNDAITANRPGRGGLGCQDLTSPQRATLDRLPSNFRCVGQVAGGLVLLAPRSRLLLLLSRDGRLVLRRHPKRPVNGRRPTRPSGNA